MYVNKVRRFVNGPFCRVDHCPQNGNGQPTNSSSASPCRFVWLRLLRSVKAIYLAGPRYGPSRKSPRCVVNDHRPPSRPLVIPPHSTSNPSRSGPAPPESRYGVTAARFSDPQHTPLRGKHSLVLDPLGALVIGASPNPGSHPMVECHVVERRTLVVHRRRMYDVLYSEPRILRPPRTRGAIEKTQQTPVLESPKTTKLYDRTSDAVTLRRGLERIAI